MRTSAISTRRAALSALIAVAVLGSGVSASATTKPKAKPKPKPVCNLLTDPQGDADAAVLGSNEDQAMDIVSADVATNATQITAVIRVVKLTNPDSMSPTGNWYEFTFTGSSNQIGEQMYVQVGPTGTIWEDGAGTGVLDYKKNEIRITLPLSYFGTGAQAIVPGPPFHNFAAHSDVNNGVKPLPTTTEALGDNAGPGKASYVAGTPSCVTVGK